MKSSPKGVLVLPTILQGLPLEDQALLKADGQIERYAKGAAIQREGETPARRVLLISGYACIEIMGKVLELIGPGTVFGSTIDNPRPNHATLRAIEPVVLMSFDAQLLRQIWTRNPLTLISLLDLSIRQVQKYRTYLFHLNNSSVDIRLAAVLWQMGEPDSDGFRRVPKCVTQAILASIIRVTREEVNKRIKVLVTTKYLVMRGTVMHMSPRTPILLQGSD